MASTLRHALERLARFNGAAGSCWDAASNLARFNEVVEMIYERGDYEGTMEWGCVPCPDGCFYLPYHLETIRTAWVGKEPIPTFDAGYMVFPGVGRASECASVTQAHIQKSGIRSPIVPPCFKPFRLEFWFEDAKANEGKEILIEGWNEGSQLTESIIIKGDDRQRAESNFESVKRVTKSRTKGQIRVAAINVNAYQEGREVVGIWPYDIENPSFAQYKLVNKCCCSAIVLFAKKKFFKFTEEDYSRQIPIQSVTALKHGYQALNALDTGDDEKYVTKIRLMEEQLSEADDNLQNTEPSASINMHYETPQAAEEDIFPYTDRRYHYRR